MKKVFPVVIVLVLIAVIGGIVVKDIYDRKYAPSKEFLDYASELGLGADEYSITLNDELLDSSRLGISVDGHVYLDADTVMESVNSRFYYDQNENILIYSFPTAMNLYTPDQTAYTVKSWAGEEQKDSGRPAAVTKNGKLYIDADLVQENTQMDYKASTEPNRIMIRTQWGSCQTVTAGKETAIRYKGGVKSSILRMAQEGEQFHLLAEYDKWYNVASDDGFIGWIAKKDAGDPQEAQTEAPAFEAPQYTSIKEDHKIDMAWHQVTNTSANSSIAQVLGTAPGINTISPTWFYLADTQGKLGSIASSSYVQTCHKAGIKVWALLSNEFPNGDTRSFDSAKTDEVLGYTSKRQTLIRQVIAAVKSCGADGINLDFESIDEAGADDYVEFVRELSIACRAEKIILSVDNYVPKYTWYYNRREQGVVADYVVIMGYDENTAGSQAPGPVASYSFVKEGIEDTLKVVDKSKVINGIPFYSRVWSTAADGSISSFACGMTEAQSYLTDHNVTAQRQESTGLNYGKYVSDKDGATYEIWLQDKDSVQDEVSLIRDYDLAGVAAWKIGFESGTDIWDVTAQVLK